MAVEDNRLAQLKALVDALSAESNETTEKRRKRAALRVIAASAHLNEEYLYQLYAGKSGKTKVGSHYANALSRTFANGRDHSTRSNI